MRLILLLLTTALLPNVSSAQTFTDATDLLDNANIGAFSVGASIIDANSDGLLDLYRFQGLYLQQTDGTFKESLSDIGLTDTDGETIEGTSVFGGIFADYDNDGYLDIMFEDLHPFSRLFRGRGDGSFYQSNQESGLDIASVLQGSAWADFDNDGYLDLFLGGDGEASGLFLNNGDATFRDASSRVLSSPFRNVYGVAAADYDNDGDIDIYVSSCSSDVESSRNMFFRNDGAAGFTDIAPLLGIDDTRGGWAVVWADVNNDGWLDLFVANQEVSGVGIEYRPGFNRLYVNDQQGGFVDKASEMGIAGHEFDFTIGASAADFNNDGWIDIMTTINGIDAPILYENIGGSTFESSTPSTLANATTQAISVADINADGWQDLFIPGFQGEKLFYNDGGSSNYLSIRLVGAPSNRSGVGARISIHAPGLSQIREISAGDGMTSQNGGLIAHFGLAEHVIVDSLVVKWPSGVVSRLNNLASNQLVTLVEGQGLNSAPTTFDLLFPVSDSTLGNLSTLEFVWNSSSDIDSEELHYQLKIFDPQTDVLTSFGTSDTSLTLDGSMFAAGNNYRWTVDVSDGSSIIRSTARNEFLVPIPSGLDRRPQASSLETAGSYPNPFSKTTVIEYALHLPSVVEIGVYDISGRRIALLLPGSQSAGEHRVNWNGQDASGRRVSPGIYLYRIRSGSALASGKLVKIE